MKHLRAKVGLSALAVLLAAGCTWKEDGLARLDDLYPTGGNGSANPATCVLPNDTDAGTPEVDGVDGGMCLGTLQGQWAVRLVQFGNISPIGEVWNLTTTDLFIATLSSDKTSMELTFCDEENSLTDDMGNPVSLGGTITPPALINALAAVPLPVPLQNGSISTDPVVWLWGVRDLADAGMSPLPTTADAGSVWDQDMDGNPGVTDDVTNPTGERYMVKRAIFNFEQTNFSPGWITGPLEFVNQQNAVGASTAVLTTVAPVTPRSECTSTYQMLCVTPAFTCASLVANYQTLFVGAP